MDEFGKAFHQADAFGCSISTLRRRSRSRESPRKRWWSGCGSSATAPPSMRARSTAASRRFWPPRARATGADAGRGQCLAGRRHDPGARLRVKARNKLMPREATTLTCKRSPASIPGASGPSGASRWLARVCVDRDRRAQGGALRLHRPAVHVFRSSAATPSPSTALSTLRAARVTRVFAPD